MGWKEEVEALTGEGNYDKSAESNSYDETYKALKGVKDTNDPIAALAWGTSQGYKPTETTLLAKEIEKAAFVKNLYATKFQLAIDDLAIVESLISSGAYKNYGGLDASIYKTLGLQKHHTGFGEFLLGLEKLNASAFIQNVDKLKNMGALSDAEGKKIADAQEEIFGLLPNAEGNYNKTVSDKKILEMLTKLKEAYTDSIKRYTDGKRFDPQTGEELSLAEYQAKYPQDSAPPIDQIKADDNKEKGINDPNTLDLRNPTSTLSMSEQMTEARKKVNLNYDNYPSGQVIIFPDGTARRKR